MAERQLTMRLPALKPPIFVSSENIGEKNWLTAAHRGVLSQWLLAHRAVIF